MYRKNKYFLNASVLLSQREQYLEQYNKACEFEEWIVKNKKYTMLNYIKYAQFLEETINYYYHIGDIKTMKVYVDKICEISQIIENVKKLSDELAYKIHHKPRLDMPEEMELYIEQMKEFIEKIN